MIKVKTEKAQKVRVLLNMTSNQGRTFAYVNEALPGNCEYAVCVPYSTDIRYKTHAIGLYQIVSDHEQCAKTQYISVSERDVLEGKTIVVSY